MRVGVLGAGSIGCYLGGRLAAAGTSVVLVGRERLREAVEAGGLELTRADREPVRLDRIEVRTDPEALADCGVVLVTVKSRDTEAAARQAEPHLGPEALVVSLQNGVRNAPTLREVLGDRVAAGMVPFNVLWTEGPRFHQGTSGPLVLEERASALVERFRSAGVEARTHPDVPGVLWGKLLINLNNAVNALSGIPLREQLSDRAYRRVMADLIEEAVGVLGRAGVEPVGLGPLQPWLVPRALRLPNWLFHAVAGAMIRIDPEARSSMWEDLQRGRPTEVDWINGEVVALGEAPRNRAIVQRVHEVEAAGTGSPGLSAQALRDLVG